MPRRSKLGSLPVKIAAATMASAMLSLNTAADLRADDKASPPSAVETATVRPEGSPASALPLWSKQRPLWELARDQTDTLPLPPSDPQPVGTFFGGTALPLPNDQLKISLWGPPERLTFSIGKTDVWDRRYFPEKPLTLAEMRERCFSDDYAKNPLGKHFVSNDAYDFPCPKPVGQLILLAPGLKGGKPPLATTRRGNGVATVPVGSGAAGGQVEAMTLMTRNVLAVRGRLDGLKDAPWVRVYRHQDTILPGESWDPFEGKRRSYPEFDYFRDAPKNGPLDPPKSGSDGKHFWITQAMPPEVTFPKGFWYVFMATVVGGSGKIETVENQTGLGTEARMSPERANGKYPGTDRPWRQLWLDYDPIRRAPGAAATAALPGGAWVVLATVVTSAETDDPMARARQVLKEAEQTGWDGLVAENGAWYEQFYRKREDGRIYHADAARDYRLQPDSPALKLGFKPVDLSGAGNYASPERRTWPRPEMEVLREPADYGAVDGECSVWLDGKPVSVASRGTPAWDKPFALDLGTEAVKPGQTQRLVVMVNKKSAAAGIWKLVELRVT